MVSAFPDHGALVAGRNWVDVLNGLDDWIGTLDSTLESTIGMVQYFVGTGLGEK
jgi:hypothetical protein